ncbi:2-oxoacid:acceptor oxidoreductase family protein [Methanoregula sp.]|jgi:pyruvate ferredoxin oxidoreductase gamma subunit|uniref:2-oxoacid:acceptor oxidoreductase family protein n=1 Tax=Methanoregula sp. TaxID=2052170 RepID=UPI002630E9CB|nr:2-oxoacid:acceptor oxidoreductase family protein [Methanoregula sp.]MDD5142228.1 2-oxoacid:acceptor oxidoreductase family protein [Methanoregula sp.]
MFEIRIHSRGGQGGVTAARLLALAAIHDGKYATAAPFYGAERRGAPIVSFVRIDDKPVRIYSQIKRPDMVIVLDASVMDVVDVLQGLKKGGKVLVNSQQKKDFPGFLSSNVDLTGIALRENLVVSGSPILNTPVIGALAKQGLVSVESAKKAIKEMFSDERNVKAAEAAYQEMNA